ncbi:solute carrier family 22 member 13-like isoform X1 [Eublepharis macularius]|uniref:Solute carrier family 22 member 13-like isoform X1 n=1 Tax=Eublepharis macularius TaxID=481883 RepID=A0AA97JY43_EUBMA|nr:solute carrier family 22 member 13-like isoform X1 [Eublepharis macularius]
MEFGDILKVIGEFGRFQKWLVLLLCIPNFLTPFHLFGQVFIVMDVPHYCNTSRIRELNWNLTKEQALNLTIPRKPDGSLEECRMFTPVQGSLPSIRFNSTEKCQDGWVYPEELQPTLLTEFNLVCERKNLNDFSQSIFMAGVLAGALVFGPLSDRIGSRNMILLTLLLMGSFGLGAGFAPSLNVYIALRFIVGSAFAGMSISMAVLNSEWVGAAYRPFAIIMTYCCNSMGQMALAGLAYSIRDWRLYQIVGSAPALCLFFYIWVLPSSARWLVTRGKVVEAKKEIQRAARINKQSIPEELLNQLAPQKKGTSGSILHLLKKPHLRKITLIMAWVWFVDSLVYYGVSLHVGDFGLDIYMTQLVFGAVEIPARASCIFLLQWMGRKKCQAAWLLLSGVVCLVIPAIPKTFPIAVTVLAVISKAALSASFSTTYVFSAEVFPTVVRQTSLGLCSMCSRIGGILAPLAGLLDEIHPAISMVLFGSTSLVGGILCFFLPETRNRDLQDDTTKASSSQLSNKAVNGGFGNGPVEEKDERWITEITKSTSL